MSVSTPYDLGTLAELTEEQAKSVWDAYLPHIARVRAMNSSSAPEREGGRCLPPHPSTSRQMPPASSRREHTAISIFAYPPLRALPMLPSAAQRHRLGAAFFMIL